MISDIVEKGFLSAKKEKLTLKTDTNRCRKNENDSCCWNFYWLYEILSYHTI